MHAQASLRSAAWHPFRWLPGRCVAAQSKGHRGAASVRAACRPENSVKFSPHATSLEGARQAFWGASRQPANSVTIPRTTADPPAHGRAADRMRALCSRTLLSVLQKPRGAPGNVLLVLTHVGPARKGHTPGPLLRKLGHQPGMSPMQCLVHAELWLISSVEYHALVSLGALRTRPRI